MANKDKNLITLAQKHAKAHYKKDLISMAAVLLTNAGNTYTGINVKYHQVRKCICAERVAIAKAIEAGDFNLDTIVTVKYFPENNQFKIINMCADCRQIGIFHQGLKVIVNDQGTIKKVPIEKIFPYPYK